MDNRTLIAIFVLAGMLLVGGGLVLTAQLVRNSRHEVSQPTLRFAVLAFGWLLALGGAAVIFGIAFAVLKDGAIGNDEWPPAVIGAGIWAIVALSGAQVISVGARIGDRTRGGHDATLDRNLSIVNFVGWSILVLPLLSFWLLSLLALAAFFVVGARQRRARQGHFLWLLAVSVAKNLPLADEIDAHASTVWGKSRWQTKSLAADLRAGKLLAAALADYPGLVPRPALLAMAVGESTGTLPEALRAAAVEQTRALQPSSQALSLTWFAIYLGVAVTVASSVLSFVMYFIIPKFKKIFNDFNTELPQLTRLVIDASDFVAKYWYLFLPLFALPTAALVVAAAAYYHGWGTILPWLTRWFPRFDTPGILRNLARTVAAAQPLSAALPVVAQQHRRRHIRERLNRVELAVEAGNSPWQALRAEKLIREPERDLLDSAQRAGNLPWALEVIADNIERRQSYRLHCWLELLRPAVVLLIGLMVAIICIGLFLPLVKLANDLT